MRRSISRLLVLAEKKMLVCVSRVIRAAQQAWIGVLLRLSCLFHAWRFLSLFVCVSYRHLLAPGAGARLKKEMKSLAGANHSWGKTARAFVPAGAAEPVQKRILLNCLCLSWDLPTPLTSSFCRDNQHCTCWHESFQTVDGHGNWRERSEWKSSIVITRL